MNNIHRSIFGKAVVFYIILFLTISQMIASPGSHQKKKKADICRKILNSLYDPTLTKGSPRCLELIRILDLRKMHKQEAFAKLAELAPEKIPIIKVEWLHNQEIYTKLKDSNVRLCLISSNQRFKFEKALEWKINSINTFVALPIDITGIKNVYGNGKKNPVAEKRQMGKLYNKYQNTPGMDFLSQSKRHGSQDQAAKVLESIQKAKANSLNVLLAHNAGGDIKFPDGSSLKISRLSEEASKSRSLYFIVSCQTARFFKTGEFSLGSLKKLHFEESLAAIKYAWQKTSGKKESTFEKFLAEFNLSYSFSEEKRKEKSKKVIIAVVVSSTVIELIAIILSSIGDDDDDDE